MQVLQFDWELELMRPFGFSMAVVIDEADGNSDYCQRVRG